MDGGCSSKKNQYYLETEAIEALIRSHISFNKPATSYYLCMECTQFHLTSKGKKNLLLSKPDIIKRIKREQNSQDWSKRLRKK